MDFQTIALVLDSAVRLSRAAGARRPCRALFGALGSLRYRAGRQDAGRRLRRGAVAALTGLGLARACRRRSSPRWRLRWCTASPRSPSAATRSSPASPSTSLPSGLTAFLGKAWFGEGGRTPQLQKAQRFTPIDLPGAGAHPRRPDPRPALCRRSFRATPARLCRLPRRAVHRVGALPHALRPAAARRRRKPRGCGYGRHLGDLAALSRRHDRRHLLRAGRDLSVDCAVRRLPPRHDGGQGLHRAGRADLRQLAAVAGARRLPPVRPAQRHRHPPAGRRSCRASGRCRCRRSRRCPIC